MPEEEREPIAQRLDRLDWETIEGSLWDKGHARTPAILEPGECDGLAALFSDDARFRSTIDMERFRFGVGTYRYLAYPLPPIVAALRRDAYRRLAPIANRWAEALGSRTRFPRSLESFLRACRARGQTKPTPLVLRYGAGGYNCLHQDLYGEVAFPLQMTCFLSRPGVDHDGGEFLLVEQRPRSQSRGFAMAPGQGEAVIFWSAERPVAGRRGFYRAKLRHGVSPLGRGSRTTLGIIFHDAR
jgi:hypothetical protein